MGTCCFTPKKSEFLWWYWLLLFSVIGIPMFLACLYMSRKPKINGNNKYKTTALIIFFSTSITSIVLAFIFLSILKEHTTFINFILGFIFCMLITIAACKAVEKHSKQGKRIMILLGFVLLWYIIYIVPWHFLSFGAFGLYGNQGSVGSIIMFFTACMPPAHYWNKFSLSNNRKNACKFLLAFLLGVILFWAATRYGNLANIYVYKFVRGQTPTSWEINYEYEVL